MAGPEGGAPPPPPPPDKAAVSVVPIFVGGAPPEAPSVGPWAMAWAAIAFAKRRAVVAVRNFIFFEFDVKYDR